MWNVCEHHILVAYVICLTSIVRNHGQKEEYCLDKLGYDAENHEIHLYQCMIEIYTMYGLVYVDDEDVIAAMINARKENKIQCLLVDDFFG